MATRYLEHRKTGSAKSTTARTLSVTATEAGRRRGRPKSVISRRDVTLGRSMEPAKGSRGTMDSIPLSSFNGSYPIRKPALYRCKLRGRRRRRPVITKLDVSRLPLLQPNEIASFLPRGHREMSGRCSCPFAHTFSGLWS